MDLDRKSLASFRVLVALARADGTLTREEEASLLVTLGGRADLLKTLLAEDVDVAAEIAELSETERQRVYQSGFALAYADGNASTTEVHLLKMLVPNERESTLLGEVFGETLDTLVPGRIVAEADPVKRDHEILEDIFKYAALSAVAGAMPVPGVALVADLAVIGIQMKMVHDIGQYWGHTLDRKALWAFVGSVAGSAGLRIAMNNLARFVPGWGSAWGAATSFASTFALGKAAERWFEEGRGLDASELKGLYEQAHAEGAEHYHSRKADIAQATAKHGQKLAELNTRLATGEITRAQYDEALLKLEVR
jgi:uncharacterized protein (DUF697 family)